MKIKEIKNVDNEVIFTYDEDVTVIWMDVILCNANLKKTEFYWGNLFMSDLSGADYEGTRFLGTNLEDVNFTKANLRNTVFARDNLGGRCDLRGANFSQTNIEEAIFEFDGAIYNGDTIFPANFEVEKSNLIRFVSEFTIPKFT